MLGNALTIARRELAAYFNSPIAYIVIVFFLQVSGYMFFTQLLLGGEADLRAYFGFAPLLFCFFWPAVTMRLFSEERMQNTLEMLMSFPLTDWDVVFGKFLAAVGLVGVAIGLTVPFAIFVKVYGPLDWGPAIGGYLGLMFISCAYLAIGVMTSVWTKNQIVAWIVAAAICFALYLSGKLLQVLPAGLAPYVQAISLDSHFQSIARGVVDTRDVLYYLTLTAIALVIAETSLASRRWR